MVFLHRNVCIYVLIASLFYFGTAKNHKDRSCPHIKSITPPVQHSEGPCWDPESNSLYYVDTFTATALRWSYETGARASYKLADRNSIAVVIPIQGTENEFLVGADRYLYKLSWDSNAKDEPSCQELLMIERNKSSNQFNDGKVDNRGRLWIGTLTRNPNLTVSDNGGSLYMINGNNLSNFEEKIPSTSISNGLAWSRDNKYFYFIDSTTRMVTKYNYDEETGDLGAKQIVFDLRKHPQLKGIPDGMTIDTDGNIWIALFGGHSIVNVDTKCGGLKRVIRMPVSYVTSACFGGPQYDILFVTTSKLHLNESQLQEEPLAGSVFAITNLGARGFPGNKFVLK